MRICVIVSPDFIIRKLCESILDRWYEIYRSPCQSNWRIRDCSSSKVSWRLRFSLCKKTICNFSILRTSLGIDCLNYDLDQISDCVAIIISEFTHLNHTRFLWNNNRVWTITYRLILCICRCCETFIVDWYYVMTDNFSWVIRFNPTYLHLSRKIIYCQNWSLHFPWLRRSLNRIRLWRESTWPECISRKIFVLVSCSYSDCLNLSVDQTCCLVKFEKGCSWACVPINVVACSSGDWVEFYDNLSFSA